MDEELAVALRAEDRRRDHGPGADAQCGRLLHDLLEGSAMNHGIANHAVIRAALPDLELGLHEGNDRTARWTRAVPQRRRDRAEDEGERDE